MVYFYFCTTIGCGILLLRLLVLIISPLYRKGGGAGGAERQNNALNEMEHRAAAGVAVLGLD